MIVFAARIMAFLFFILSGYAASSMIAWSFNIGEWDLWLRTCFAVWCLFFGYRTATVKE